MPTLEVVIDDLKALLEDMLKDPDQYKQYVLTPKPYYLYDSERSLSEAIESKSVHLTRLFYFLNRLKAYSEVVDRVSHSPAKYLLTEVVVNGSVNFVQMKDISRLDKEMGDALFKYAPTQRIKESGVYTEMYSATRLIEILKEVY